MVSKVKTFSFVGIDVLCVDVQVKISNGAPNFTIVGLPDKAVGESKERVRAAITSTGISWFQKKITVNLSPADLQKEGSHFDLAIAIGILAEAGIIQQNSLDNFFILGELGLDGSVSGINGIISAVVGAKKNQMGIICPKKNHFEASFVDDVKIIAIENLIDLVGYLKGEKSIVEEKFEKKITNKEYPDFLEVKGQKIAKRALEIAAAGGHNLLMIGAPGTGKSMLASRLPGILPPCDLEEILEINMIASLSGKSENNNLINFRPYREVHHSCSMPAMIGGGSKAKPGEISLSHNGVLFLDELAEFPRQVLDSLRQPLETGKITISRANCHITYPANFQLISAMNPCRCGFLGDVKKQCKKFNSCHEEYKSKISGPFLDRIDIVVNVDMVNIFNQENNSSIDSSKEILSRVTKARNIQKTRYKKENEDRNFWINSRISSKMVEKFCILDSNCQEIMQNFVQKTSSSMRGITRVLRVARTIADLNECENINQNHLIEAISYRRNLGN